MVSHREEGALRPGMALLYAVPRGHTEVAMRRQLLTLSTTALTAGLGGALGVNVLSAHSAVAASSHVHETKAAPVTKVVTIEITGPIAPGTTQVHNVVDSLGRPETINTSFVSFLATVTTPPVQLVGSPLIPFALPVLYQGTGTAPDHAFPQPIPIAQVTVSCPTTSSSSCSAGGTIVLLGS